MIFCKSLDAGYKLLTNKAQSCHKILYADSRIIMTVVTLQSTKTLNVQHNELNRSVLLMGAYLRDIRVLNVINFDVVS